VVAGAVRLTATRHAFETIMRPVLPGFLSEHPQVSLEVLIDYQLRDIIAERLDAGIRLGEKLEKDMVAVGVGPQLRMAVVASPAYLADRAAPQTPHDLTEHACVNYRMMASGQIYNWEFERDGRALDIKVTGPLIFNEPELMLEAALDGFGVAYVLEEEASQHIKTGRLIRLLEAWTPPFSGYFLYYPSRRQMPPALGALVTSLRRQRSSRARN
jgi:DNA-binding transcriptional LysR family regulator